MMRCVVINLPNAWERREHTQEQFERTNLAYELWPATAAHSVTFEQMHAANCSERFARGLRPIDQPALACLLSHMDVWRSLLDDDADVIAVFEDDAMLHPDLPEFLDALQGHVDKFDVAMLNRNTRAIPYFPVHQVTRLHTLGRLKYSDFGGYGYVITRRAASHMLTRFAVPVYEADWILPRFWVNGLDHVLWANPPLVFHNYVLPSYIDHAREAVRADHRATLKRRPHLLLRRFGAMIRQNIVRRHRWRQVRRQDKATERFLAQNT